MLKLTYLFLVISLLGILLLLFFVKYNDEFFEFRGVVDKEIISDDKIGLFLFNSSNFSLSLSCFNCYFDSFLKGKEVYVLYRNISGYYTIEELKVLD